MRFLPAPDNLRPKPQVIADQWNGGGDGAYLQLSPCQHDALLRFHLECCILIVTIVPACQAALTKRCVLFKEQKARYNT